jgi:hypothetical protein
VAEIFKSECPGIEKVFGVSVTILFIFVKNRL